ncbi:MAG: patatin-like phospholipase family protein, partial [Longimicrobiales bacterium]
MRAPVALAHLARVALLSAGLSAPPLLAQATDALVLGGGGARGLAHVGVLQALEQAGIDSDLVVGTSMGAIIGALYASGLGADSVRQIIAAQDWNSLFRPFPLIVGPDRRVLQPTLQVPLDVGTVVLASELVPDVWINRTLTHQLFEADARARGDFDRLPRRYRAVAADLGSGEAVVLAGGSLARAVRASMAVPGVFAPVYVDGRLLVDGGVASYLPVGIARDLGAQHVIASDVLRPAPAAVDQGAFELGLRGLRLILKNTLTPADSADVLILPALRAGASELDFPARPEALFRAGYTAATAALAPDTSPRPGVPARGARPAPALPARIDGVVIESSDAAVGRLAATALQGLAGARFDAAAVLRHLDRLYATGLINAAWPTVRDSAGQTLLDVALDVRRQVSMVGGAGYDNDVGVQVWVTGAARVGASPWTLRATASDDGLDRWAELSLGSFVPRATPLAWSAAAHVRQAAVRDFGPDGITEHRIRRSGGQVGAETMWLHRGLAAALTLIAEEIDDLDGGGSAVGPALRVGTLTPWIIVGTPMLLEAEQRWGSASYGRAHARAAVTRRLRAWQIAAVGDVAAATADAPADVLPALGRADGVP